MGLRFDLKGRSITNRSDRTWRFFLASQLLAAQGACSGEVMAVWLGHAVHLAGVDVAALSCLDHCYAFKSAAASRVLRFDDFVTQEILTMASVGLVLECRLDLERSSTVYVSDASLKGFALLGGTFTPAETAELCRARERWRFRWQVHAQGGCTFALAAQTPAYAERDLGSAFVFTGGPPADAAAQLRMPCAERDADGVPALAEVEFPIVSDAVADASRYDPLVVGAFAADDEGPIHLSLIHI